MKVLGLQVRVPVLGSRQMHDCPPNDLVNQDSVGQLARTDTDIKCAKVLAKEVGDKTQSENVDTKNPNEFMKVL
jgi:hypothetical protein